MQLRFQSSKYWGPKISHISTNHSQVRVVGSNQTNNGWPNSTQVSNKRACSFINFQHFAPSACFFHPARLFHPAQFLIFGKISNLFVYSIPARLFLSRKEILTPCSFHSFLTYNWMQMQTNVTKSYKPPWSYFTLYLFFIKFH